MNDGVTASVAAGLLRRDDEEGGRVTYVELFFDLVFAFAVTQISGVLGSEPRLLDVLEGTAVTVAVWWVWVYTAWATNWLNPERRLVLWLLVALSALGLVISEAIPSAFGDRAAVFAIAYLAYGLVRTLGVIAATRRAAPAITAGQARILVWSAVAGVFWIAGILVADAWLRLAIWTAAIAIEYSGPSALFWIPGRGRSNWTAWRIRGEHFSERAALFIIILLGESILVTGRGLAAHRFGVALAVAAASAFANAVAMWLLYFAHGQERGRRYITGREASGPVARVSYTYLHVTIVLGLVLSGHGAELALEGPDEHSDLVVQGIMVLGTALYLVGLLAFKLSIGVRARWIPWHLAGSAALVALFSACAAHVIEPSRLETAVLTTAVLVLVVAGDEVLWARRSARAAAGDQAAS